MQTSVLKQAHPDTHTYMLTHAHAHAHAPTHTMSQVTSVVMLGLPKSEYHVANASIYLVVWWVVMVPRFLLNVQVRVRAPCVCTCL